MMNEEKKVTNNKKGKTKQTKKQGNKTGSNKNVTNKKNHPAKKGTPAKKNTNSKVNQVKKVNTNKQATTPAPKNKTDLKKVEVNYEPRDIKVQDNVEFPENKYSNDGVKNTRDVQNTIIFTSSQKENIDEVVKELKEDKKQHESVEKEMVRSIAKRNAIIIGAVIMVAIVALTVSYLVKENKKNKNEGVTPATLNNNVYDKIIQNSKERDERLNNKKDEEPEEKPVEQLDYSNIRTITLEDFEEKVLQHEKMVILISKSTCYYCNLYEPIINEELNVQEKNIYRINVEIMKREEVAVLMEYYTFEMTPTLFYIDENGVVTDELVGFRDKEAFSEWMKNK